MMSYFNTVHLF